MRRAPGNSVRAVTEQIAGAIVTAYRKRRRAGAGVQEAAAESIDEAIERMLGVRPIAQANARREQERFARALAARRFAAKRAAARVAARPQADGADDADPLVHLKKFLSPETGA